MTSDTAVPSQAALLIETGQRLAMTAADGHLPHLAEALFAFEEAARLEPDNAMAFHSQGVIHSRRRDWDKAVAAFGRAAALAPNDITLVSSHAAVLASTGRYGESAEGFRRAIALAPEDAGLWFRCGHYELFVGRYAGAVEALQRATTLDPGSKAILHDLVIANLALGRFDAAAAAYRRMRAPLPGDQAQRGDAAKARAEGHGALASGDPVKAAAAFRRGLALDIHDDSLHAGLQRALRAGLQSSEAEQNFPYADPLSENERVFVDMFQIFYYWLAIERRETVHLRWFGQPLLKAPGDMWVYQEIIWETKPDVIVEAGTFKGGSAYFYACLFDLLGRGTVITVDIEADPARPKHKRIKYVTGSSTDAAIVREVRRHIRPKSKVMVILDSDHSRDHVMAELKIWSSLVTRGNYLIVEDTTINFNPVYSAFYNEKEGPTEAVVEFMKDNKEFHIDKSRERFMVTVCANGFLRRL